ncbi:hypothetical protein P4O66_003561 [Electrophorus voltai]|uniref:Reverse transcriptase domain-containing protein n=1 Tax=Electrophorus voltai TaxID=2609070 RepID=A0AAD9E2J6_9TELE|nr:hypothetical protein P4O66_003561 [Electrophorus voltai]
MATDTPRCSTRSIVRRSKPLLKQVRIWPAGAISALPDCFEQTTWIAFKDSGTDGDTVNLEKYTASVIGYISKCIDDVTVSKTIITRPNQKPWMTAEVRMLLGTCDSAFRTGDKEALRKVRAKLSRAIREAKRAYTQKIHGHFKDTGDIQRMWKGIQTIMNYRKTSVSCDSEASLPDTLNDFSAQFEAQNNVAAEKSIPPQNYQVLCLTVAEHLIGKLSLLGLNTSLCNWILDFLAGRPQSVQIGSSTSNTTTLSTGAPQGSVLSPLLFTLLTHDCAAMHSSNYIIKFTDDTTMVGLINKDGESAYREEVRELVSLCMVNNLYLNVDKTKEMVVDFRRARGDHSPLTINGSSVEKISSVENIT